MWIRFWNWFTKITAWPAQALVFRTKVYYEDKALQSRFVKGKAIIVSNHTTVFDFAEYLFVFFPRTIRAQMAEVLFEKKLLGVFLNMLGGIKVNRNTHDMGFMAKSEAILKKGGVLLIFPEGRLPRPGEARPLPFKEGAAFLALSTDTPVIPVYTNGKYFSKKRARIIIGKPMTMSDYAGDGSNPTEDIKLATDALRQRIIELGGLLNERIKEEK